MIVHENYYKGGLFNDIALLILTEPVELGKTVSTACLPPQNFSSEESRCFVSGWGSKQCDKNENYATIMKKIDLPIISRQTCLDKLRMTRVGSNFNLHQSFICAGGDGEGKSTYFGDGGSPLMCPLKLMNEQYYQAGIVAWGIGCADDIPGGFCR